MITGDKTQVVQLSKLEIIDLVSDGVDRGIERAFIRLGVDHSSPLEMQKDFQFMRSSRKFLQSMATKAVSTILVLGISGFVGYAVLGMEVASKEVSKQGNKQELSQVELGIAIIELAKQNRLDAIME